MTPEPVADTAKICDLLGINPRETPELKKCGALMPAAGRGRWLLKTSVQNYCAHLRRLVDLKNSDAASLNKELTSKKILKTDMEGKLAELRLEQEKKQLISAQSVKEEGLRIGAMLTAKLQSMGADVATACAGLGEAQLHAELRKRINLILTTIKSELTIFP
jgi:hypothetical protein